MEDHHRRADVFQPSIRRWFRSHKRDLPWRKTRNPYHIVVSEIMLQQTQVSRVIPKYRTFLRTFPSWRSLADAPLSRVLHAWSGLGYNRRARQLQMLARTVQQEYHGKLPQAEHALRKLPGIGPYTARAIRVFAFHRRAAPQDTNINRVVRRYFFGERTVPHAELEKKVAAVLPARDAFWWNHAMMDFGAAVCTAQRPACATCPLQATCKAAPHFLSGRIPTVRRKPQAEPFHASLRYLRGRIIHHLLHGANSVGALSGAVSRETRQPQARVRLAIQKLVAEGLVARSGKSLRLP